MTTKPRVIIGKRQGEYGIWVSRPGYSALSTDNTQLLMSPEIIATQPYMTGQIYANGTPVSTVVNHNLGYIPMVSIFSSTVTGNTPNTVTVTTTQLLINGTQNNGIYVNFQGGGRTVYTYIDVIYIIFRNELVSS